VNGYLVDTSVFVAAEQRHPLVEPPPSDARPCTAVAQVPS
jgi:hypothetical protein